GANPTPTGPENTPDLLPGPLGAGALGFYFLLFLLFMPICIGAITSLVARSYLGEQAGAGEALREAFRRFWRLLGTSLLVGLLLLSPFLPGLLLVVAGALASSSALAVIGVLLLFPAVLAEVALA